MVEDQEGSNVALPGFDLAHPERRRAHAEAWSLTSFARITKTNPRHVCLGRYLPPLEWFDFAHHPELVEGGVSRCIGTGGVSHHHTQSAMKMFVSPGFFAFRFDAKTNFFPSGENIGKPSKVSL